MKLTQNGKEWRCRAAFTSAYRVNEGELIKKNEWILHYEHEFLKTLPMIRRN